jgi:hypothetical protein
MAKRGLFYAVAALLLVGGVATASYGSGPMSQYKSDPDNPDPAFCKLHFPAVNLPAFTPPLTILLAITNFSGVVQTFTVTTFKPGGIPRSQFDVNIGVDGTVFFGPAELNIGPGQFGDVIVCWPLNFPVGSVLLLNTGTFGNFTAVPPVDFVVQ